MTNSVPARLHAILAANAQYGVVFRRGPSKRVVVIGWNTRTDEFKVGQWLAGRIYERRSDLSPDGKHLIYFAMNGRWDSEMRGSWTAISRAPYLRAEAIWPKGDCWNGGGLFLDSKRFWLNDGCSDEVQQGSVKLRRIARYPWHESYGGECPGVYYVRLQMNGWAMKKSSSDGSVVTFEKPLEGHWILRKLAHATVSPPVGRAVYFDTHELVNRRSGDVIECAGWEWADVDRDRLVWAEAGRLCAGRVSAKGVETKELFDFNPMTFEAIEAPY